MKPTQPEPVQHLSSSPEPPRRHSSWWWFWLLVALGVGAGCGYWASQLTGHQAGDDRYRQLDLLAAQRLHDYQVLQGEADALRGQMLVEESTRKSLEAALQSTQAELGRVRDQLAFYDRLLPPGPSGSISIRALDFERRGPTLLYKVLLMRNAPGGDSFTGQMQFRAKGVLKGKQVELTLNPATAHNAEEAAADVSDAPVEANGLTPLALRFEQFQRSEGLLSLPEGFQPVSVSLNVLEGKTLRTSRSVNLPAAE